MSRVDYDPAKLRAGWFCFSAAVVAERIQAVLTSFFLVPLNIPPRVEQDIDGFIEEMLQSIEREEVLPSGTHLLGLRAIGACSADGSWGEAMTRGEADAHLRILAGRYKNIQKRERLGLLPDRVELMTVFGFFNQVRQVEEFDMNQHFCGLENPGLHLVH